jgi:hypothetical protein
MQVGEPQTRLVRPYLLNDVEGRLLFSRIVKVLSKLSPKFGLCDALRP